MHSLPNSLIRAILSITQESYDAAQSGANRTSSTTNKVSSFAASVAQGNEASSGSRNSSTPMEASVVRNNTQSSSQSESASDKVSASDSEEVMSLTNSEVQSQIGQATPGLGERFINLISSVTQSSDKNVKYAELLLGEAKPQSVPVNTEGAAPSPSVRVLSRIADKVTEIFNKIVNYFVSGAYKKSNLYEMFIGKQETFEEIVKKNKNEWIEQEKNRLIIENAAKENAALGLRTNFYFDPQQEISHSDNDEIICGDNAAKAKKVEVDLANIRLEAEARAAANAKAKEEVAHNVTQKMNAAVAKVKANIKMKSQENDGNIANIRSLDDESMFPPAETPIQSNGMLTLARRFAFVAAVMGGALYVRKHVQNGNVLATTPYRFGTDVVIQIGSDASQFAQDVLAQAKVYAPSVLENIMPGKRDQIQ